MDDIRILGMPVLLTTHAIRRAQERGIAYPVQVEQILQTGKITRRGKHGVRVTKNGRHGSLVCIGEIRGGFVRITTIERGN